MKWIDERRGLWMYSHREKVRERWFKAGELQRRLGRWFSTVRVEYLLSPAEQGRFPFRVSARHAAVRIMDRSGAGRRRVMDPVFADACVAATSFVEDAARTGADSCPGRRGVRDGKGPAPVRRFAGAGLSCTTAAWFLRGSLRGLVGADHVTIDIDALRRGEPVDPFEALVDNKAAHGSWADRPVDAFRAGGAIAQGVDTPATDRQTATRQSPAREVSGSGWPRFRIRIARPSASGPTSMSPCPKTTTGLPRHALRWTGAARTF